MEPVLFPRHRVIMTIVVLALFALAIAIAVFRISAVEEADASARRQAAAREAAQLKADFDANKTAISASIRADVAAGRLEEAEALLKKYRPVAGGALEALSNAQRPSSK